MPTAVKPDLSVAGRQRTDLVMLTQTLPSTVTFHPDGSVAEKATQAVACTVRDAAFNVGRCGKVTSAHLQNVEQMLTKSFRCSQMY